MGVKGLLTCLSSITRTVPLEKYRGLTVAVDACSWLHKGIFACNVKDLARCQRGVGTDGGGGGGTRPTEAKCAEYAARKAELLRRSFGINVLLVIDGDSLPSKKEENLQRRAERDRAYDRAVAAEGARDGRAARRFYAQACSITQGIKHGLIEECRGRGIPFLVAPYEADAQMARLAHTGAVDLVITEDSDMLVYGCPRVLYKADFKTGQGQEIQLMRDLGENVSPSFRNFTHDMFVFMAILSGCDYCKGVPGIGIKLAHKLVRVHRTPSKIFNALRTAGRMPRDFEDCFWKAYRTFRHQRVFCPSKQVVEPLWPIPSSHTSPSGGDLWPYLGEEVDPHVAAKVADGTLHPSSKQPWAEALLADGSIARHPLTKSRESARHAGPNVDNVWNVLVYSENGDGREETSRQPDEENHRGERQRPSKHAFSFFPPRRVNDSSEQTDGVKAASRAEKHSRPPLQEIYVGSSNSRQSGYVPPPSHKDVPIHFGDYSSRLVGRSFKPISRKRKRNEVKVGTKSSNFVAKLMQNAERHRPSLPIVHEEEARKVEVDVDEKVLEMFKHRRDRRANSRCGDEFAAFSSAHNNDAVSLQESRLYLLPAAWQTEARSDFLSGPLLDGDTYSQGAQQCESDPHPWQEQNQEPCFDFLSGRLQGMATDEGSSDRHPRQEPCVDSYDDFADGRCDFDNVLEYDTFANPVQAEHSQLAESWHQTSAYRAPRPTTGSFSLSNRVSCYSSSECQQFESDNQDQDTRPLYAFGPLESSYKSRPRRDDQHEVTSVGLFAQEDTAALASYETEDIFMFPTWS